MIIEGELVDDRLLVYDIITGNNVDIETTPYHRRLQLLEPVAAHLNLMLTTFRVELKPFQLMVGEPKVFFSGVSKILDDRHTYETDGLVFTPFDAPYRSARILKWKPPSQLSIDLWLNETGVLTVDRDGKSPFVGTERFPYPVTTISDYESRNLVVEVVLDEGRLRILRSRLDKPVPNARRVIDDTWTLMNDPIEEKVLRGETIRLVRKYHNRIKRRLLSGKQGFLLDIGSGKGGDFSKWRNFSRVLGVEPCREHIDEFQRRWPGRVQVVTKDEIGSLRQTTSSVVIFQGGAEDLSEIETLAKIHFGGPPDVISSMLSMSLTGEESIERILSSRVLTKPSTVFVFLTIYQLAVAKFFADKTDQLSINKDGPVRLRGGPGRLHIDLRDTIVIDQWETPATLSFVPLDVHLFRTDQEPLMSPYDQILAPLYVYGEYQT